MCGAWVWHNVRVHFWAYVWASISRFYFMGVACLFLFTRLEWTSSDSYAWCVSSLIDVFAGVFWSFSQWMSCPLPGKFSFKSAILFLIKGKKRRKSLECHSYLAILLSFCFPCSSHIQITKSNVFATPSTVRWHEVWSILDGKLCT